MRVFHSLVFDENIESSANLYTDASWNSQLGLPDKLTIFALTDTASGTPTLSVAIEEGPDQVHWQGKLSTATTTADIFSTFATTANQILVGRDAGTVPSAAFIRLRITLTGASAKAHVRLWVTGRGEQIP
jgi:hypothetical protein